MNTLKKIVGWVLIILGCWIGFICGLCVVVALFGGMEFDSFSEGIVSALSWLMMAVVFGLIARVGFKLKKSALRAKKQPAQAAKPVETVKKAELSNLKTKQPDIVKHETPKQVIKEQPLPNMPALMRDRNPFEAYQEENSGLDSFYNRNQDIKNYYLLVKGYSVIEAVEQYLKNGKADGIVHIRVDQMPSSTTERLMDEFFRECEKNQIRIVTYAGKYCIYDAVSGQEFAVQISTWPGSVDDAATYGEWKFVPKKTKMPRAEKSDVAMTNKDNNISPNEKVSEDVFLFYEKRWAGKAENGVDQILLKIYEDQCVITYKSLSRNCYAAPPVEDVRTEERHRSFSQVLKWSQEEFLAFINRTFRISLNKDDCCSEKDYLAWVEKNNTEYYSMEIIEPAKNLVCLFDVSSENAPYGLMQSVRMDKENGKTYLVTELVHFGAGVWSEEKSAEPISYERVQSLAVKEGTVQSLKYKDMNAGNWEETCFPERKLKVKETETLIEIEWTLNGTLHKVKMHREPEWYELSHDYFIDGRWYSKVGQSGKLMIRQENVAEGKSFALQYKKYVEDEAALNYVERFIQRNPIGKPDNYVEWNYKDGQYGNIPFFARIDVDGSGGWFLCWGCKSFPTKSWESIGGAFGRGASIKLNKEEFLALLCNFIKYGSTKNDFVPLWNHLMKKRKKKI